MQRSRSSAVLLRLLGLGLILFGLLYTHAISPQATVSHVAAGEDAPVAGVHFEANPERQGVASATSALSEGEPSDGHHDGHGQRHAVGECALGQPPQGPVVAVPCLSPLSSASGEIGTPRPVYARYSEARDSLVPIAHAADSAVLRI